MNIELYENYFKNDIVGKFKKINQFYQIDMFEFENFVEDLRAGIFQTPLLVLENYNTGTAGQLDNVHDNLSCAFVILDKFNPRALDKISKTTFLKNVENITKQVRKRMITDSEGHCHLMTGLKLESINMAKTEVLADAFMGYRLRFSLEHIDETELVEEDWF